MQATASTPVAAQPVVTAAAPAVGAVVAEATVPATAVGSSTNVAATSSPSAKGAAEPAQWYMQIPSGDRFGPIPRSELDQWYQDGRINHECQIFCEGWSQWRWAPDVYPALNAAPTSSVNLSGAQESFKGSPARSNIGSNATSNPYAAAQTVSTTTTPAAPAFSGQMELGWQSAISGLRVSKFALWLCAAGTLFILFLVLVQTMTGPSAPPQMPSNSNPQAMQKHQQEMQAWQRSAGRTAEFSAWLGSFMLWSGAVVTAGLIANFTAWIVIVEIPRSSGQRLLLAIALGLSAGSALIMVFMFQTLMVGFAGGGMSGEYAGTFGKIMLVISMLLFYGSFACYGLFAAGTGRYLGLSQPTIFGFIAIGLNGFAFLLFLIMFFATSGSPALSKTMFILLSLTQAGSFGLLGWMNHLVGGRAVQLQAA
ncbi:MAG: GYF domain-containing protein [Pirellulales bacterium]